MGALNFGVLDALDIIIAAFLLYQIYRLLKGTAAIPYPLGNGRHLPLIPLGPIARDAPAQ